MNPKKGELFDFIIKMLVPVSREIGHAGLGESCNAIGPRRSRKEGLNGHQSSKIKIMVPNTKLAHWAREIIKHGGSALKAKNGRREHRSTTNSQMQKRDGVGTNPLKLSNIFKQHLKRAGGRKKQMHCYYPQRQRRLLQSQG